MRDDRERPELGDATLPSGSAPSPAAGPSIPSEAAREDPAATLASDAYARDADRGDLPLLKVPGFRLLRRLGEGGMGIVYEAEQETPRRRVALKVVRGGPIADDLHVRLFRREADMLARLEHPNIAAIYESGRTPDGHHWFAMELVEGDPLDEWLAKRRGPGTRSAAELRERLEVFRAICDAVQYAHQRGVIHRDLKPSNIVVPPAAELTSTPTTSRASSSGARPRVKVLDFGLARLADPDSEGASIASTSGTIRGTLAYMSPEQARGDVELLDVRSDVYALGVVLHEVLVDRRPYEVPPKLLDAVKTIQEAEPPPLAANWPGPGKADADLETIVRKAMAKDPDGRYASVGDVGEDLRRWLASEPILARPPSTLYQLRKLVARHRAPVAVAAAVLVLVLASAIGLSFLYVASERNLDRALLAEESARAEAATAKSTYEFVVGLFEESRPDRARGEDVTAREILDRGAERVRRELKDEPLVRARLTATIGDVYQRMGLYDRSRPLFDESLELRLAHLDANDPEVAESRSLLAQAIEGLGDYEAAGEEFGRARAIWEARGDTTGIGYARVLSVLGWMQGEIEQDRAGLENLERARAIIEAIPAPKREDLTGVLNNLATVKMNLGDLEGARADLQRSLAILRESVPEVHPDIADALTNLGVLESMSGNGEESLADFEASLAIREIVVEPDGPELLQAIGNVAIGLGELGRPAEAQPLFERSLAAMERIHGPDHPRTAQAVFNLGLNYHKLGRPLKARELLERSLGVRQRVFGEESIAVSVVLYFLAETHLATGEPSKARTLLEQVVAIDSRALGPTDPEVASDLEALIPVLRDLGDEEAAAAAETRRRGILTAVESDEEATR